MKTKITTLCAIILAGTQSLFSQWVIQNPGVNELFQKIDCVSGTNCFTCADNGTMLKTIDGSTWIDKSNGIPGNIFLHQLQVLDKDTVYVYGDLNLYRTFDGGENWTELPSSVGGGPHFFVNASIGYVSADDLYKTTDQGASWDLVKVDGGGTAMFFVNENFGIIARNTIGTTDLIQIYKTTDGGVNQTLVHQYSSSTGTIKDLQMISPQIGYACSLNGKILKTIDGGDNWTELTHPLQGSGLFTSLDFINTSNGYVVGLQGAVLKTTDGGQSWTDESHTVQYPQNEVSVASLDTIYIAAQQGNMILKNSDANLTAKIFENEIEIGKIFPNPAQDVLHVAIKKANASIKVFDLLGNMIQEQKLNQNQINSIKLSDFNNGVYLYEISENSVTLSTGKFIKN